VKGASEREISSQKKKKTQPKEEKRESSRNILNRTNGETITGDEVFSAIS